MHMFACTLLVTFFVASHIAWVWERECAYIEHALSKWYEAFWGKTQEQNHAGLAQSGQYHTTWSGLLHFCTSKDEMKMSFISLSLFIIMLSITLVGSMQALIQIRYFIKCAINVRPLSCWSLYMM
jgi:hypothetical protein